MLTTKERVAPTATRQMIRAELNHREFRHWMEIKRLPDPDHAAHCLLTECFGRDLAPKPFRLILPADGGAGVLYGYGTATAAQLRQAAATYADPLQLKVLAPGSINSKPMPAEWERGQRLGFETRVRPVVRMNQDPAQIAQELRDRLRAGQLRLGQECDVYEWEQIVHPPGGNGQQRSRERTYTRWLAVQLERQGGARLELATARLVSFRRVRFQRKRQSGYSEGPDVILQGNLTVADPAAFPALLARGIGRHRAYGYGMLLLRPPGPADPQ